MPLLYNIDNFCRQPIFFSLKHFTNSIKAVPFNIFCSLLSTKRVGNCVGRFIKCILDARRIHCCCLWFELTTYSSQLPFHLRTYGYRAYSFCSISICCVIYSCCSLIIVCFKSLKYTFFDEDCHNSYINIFTFHYLPNLIQNTCTFLPW